MSKKKLSNLSKALLGMSAGMRRAGIMDAPTHEQIVQRISGKPLSPASAAALDAPRPNRATRQAMRELEAGQGRPYGSTDELFKELGI